MSSCGGIGGSINLPMVIAVSGGTALIATYLYQSQKKKKDCSKPLPGPTPFPLVGNLFQLSTRRSCIPSLFNRWANKYGPIYGIELGSTSAVVLNNMCAISEAFESKGHIFSDRPNWLPLISLVYQERGFAWQSGEQWQELRHCVVKAVGGCAFNSETIEERIQHEITKLVREFAKFEQECRPFCPFDIIHKAVTNILCTIAFGCRYKYNSGQLEKFIHQIRQLTECNILDSTTFFPFLATLPLPRLKNAVCNMEEILCFIEKEVKRHREVFSPTCVRDLIDLYLKDSAGGSRKSDDMCKQNVEVAIIDMFACGSEPTTSALCWIILVLVAFPDIQRKCQSEIDSVVCGGRLPNLDDMNHLPYVQATIHEVLRRFTVLPLGIPHSTQQEAPLCGFMIPCETVVICNHQAVHLNDSYWNNPSEFDPERFLDDDCEFPRLLECINNFIPFGIGPRSCAGKDIAMDMLFLMTTGLLQRFEFQKGCDCEINKCFEGQYNFTFSPLPFKIKLRVHC